MRWGVLLLIAACGDNLRAIDSGSRLQAIVDVGGEGAEALAYFHDRETDIDCVFALDPSTTWRCLPRFAANVVGYADASCTQPIYECRDCLEGRSAVVREPGCAVPIAQPVTLVAANPPAFIRVALGCVAVSAPAGGYFTTVLDDASRFAAADIESRDLSDELGVKTLVTADGARMLHHGFQRSDGRTCTFALTGGTPRCLPGTPAQTELGLAYFYAEDTCSSRIALSSPRAGCELTTHARVEGAVHTLTPLGGTPFERSAVNSSCFPTLETDLAFWTIGPVDTELPAAELIALGDAPPRPVFYAARAKPTVNASPMEFARRWIDAENKVCFAHPTLTHGRRCIPKSLSLFPANTRYAEATCTQEIVANPDAALYAITWDRLASVDDVTEDSVIAQVHPLRSYPGVDVFVRENGQCTLLPEPAVLMAYVGLPTDLQKFPSITRRAVD